MTTRRLNRWVKHALDFALVVPTLLLISPLLALVALLIKLDSPGPVFYRRRVVGLGGREFSAYKFRTMYVDNNARLIRRRDEWMEVLRGGELDNDPRLTRVGRFLRRTGLDELPRLFNVLDRTMSLVGPRMMTRTELMKYGHRVDGYTAVRPGLTGLWQVRGHSRNFDDRARLESEYISNWSVLLDVQILLQTVFVAFTFHSF
jgi:lipopolysaccharide/colanic/teichoic acid biosynthesis glycosyltransferase